MLFLYLLEEPTKCVLNDRQRYLLAYNPFQPRERDKDEIHDSPRDAAVNLVADHGG
jgi:hypothetical protein